MTNNFGNAEEVLYTKRVEDESIERVFCDFLRTEKRKSKKDVYLALRNEFDLQKYSPGVYYTYVNGTDSLIEDYAEGVLVSYFKSNKSELFIQRVLEETCTQTELNRLNREADKMEGKAPGKYGKISDGMMLCALLLHLWSRGKGSQKTLQSAFLINDQTIKPKSVSAHNIMDQTIISKAPDVSARLKRRMERKIGKPLGEAILEAYRVKNDDAVQSVLPDMGEKAMKDTSARAADAICDSMAALTVREFIERTSAVRCSAENSVKIANSVTFDTQTVVTEGVYIMSVFGMMKQCISTAGAEIDCEYRIHQMTEPAVKKEYEKASAEMKAEKEDALKKLEKEQKKSERLEKRAKQAEARMRQAEKSAGQSADEKKLHDEIRMLHKSAEKMQDENRGLAEKNRQLEEKIALLEEAYSEQATEETTADVDMNAKYLFVTDKDIMIRKLHAWFPESVISSETDIKSLTDVKLIVYICPEVSHSEYYRAKKMCKSLGVPAVHCSRISLSAVCDCIRSEGREYGH